MGARSAAAVLIGGVLGWLAFRRRADRRSESDVWTRAGAAPDLR